MQQVETDRSLRHIPHVMNLKTLVLNADYQALSTYPLSIISMKKAIKRIFKNRVDVVETWKDAFVYGPSGMMPAPKTVMLKTYVYICGDVKFSRRNVLLRDRFRCQYCGGKFRSEELTFDHLIPKSRGGKTEWTNIVMACVGCNNVKGNKLPNYDGRKGIIRKDGNLRPLKIPHKPTNQELLRSGIEFLPDSIMNDWGSWLYWNCELES
jgi:5-methylcytosine-specific restriction endonuclease McrA